MPSIFRRVKGGITINKIGIKLLNYALVALVIIFSSSVYIQPRKSELLNYIFLLILFCMFAVAIKNLGSHLLNRKTFVRLVFMVTFIIAYAFFYKIIGTIGNLSNYLLNYCILLPILIMYMASFNDKKICEDILKKYANIIVIITAVSLFFYFFGSIAQLIHTNQTRYLDWGTARYVKSYYNIYFETQPILFNGEIILRNSGIFAEAPMFALQLVVALTAKLFLYKSTQKIELSILFLGILTTFSTIGIILAILLVMTHLFIQYFSKGIKSYMSFLLFLFFFIAVILAIIIIYFIFQQKKLYGSHSVSVRTNDYIIGYEIWKSKPIIGYGYLDSSIFDQLLGPQKNGFLSNSIMQLLSQGGLYLLLVYLIPFIAGILYATKTKTFVPLIFSVVVFILYATLLFPYTYFIILFLSFGYVLLILDKKPIQTGELHE